MNENDFLDGVSNIDDDVVERFVTMDNKLQRKANRSKSIWLRIGALAACLCLAVSAILILPMLRADDASGFLESDTSVDPSTNHPDHTPIIFDATVSPEQLSGSDLEFIVGSSSNVNGGESSEPPKFEFGSGIAIKARVIENYPDTYYKLDTSSEYRPRAYRLVKMETIDVIRGKGIPQYFLYLIPEYVYVDMSVYDSLLISMSQIGTENYVLKNGTQNQMEAFDLPVFADHQDSPELGSIIAFSDGIFDESLWQNPSWLYGYQFAKIALDDPENIDLVVARGDSESAVISKIKERNQDWWYPGYQEPSVLTLDFTTQEAQDALEYVKPFTNGVFSQRYEPYYGNGQLIFRRYINGCQTEETITIDILTEEVTYSEIRYTSEDMSRLENISLHLKNKANEYVEQLPTPPHTDTEGKKLLCLNLYAWYVKVDGKLYGVIKTVWRYMEEDNYFLQYYDDAYVLYDISAGVSTEISRDDLVGIVGTRNVYMGEYGKVIEVPM